MNDKKRVKQTSKDAVKGENNDKNVIRNCWFVSLFLAAVVIVVIVMIVMIMLVFMMVVMMAFVLFFGALKRPISIRYLRVRHRFLGIGKAFGLLVSMAMVMVVVKMEMTLVREKEDLVDDESEKEPETAEEKGERRCAES